MGCTGDKNHHLISFHLHMPQIHFHHDHHGTNKKDQMMMRDIPKGCVAILVGEEMQRFVIPVIYINHPLFMQLLKEAEEEFGFDQKGPITIPCQVEEFRYVQGLIDKEQHMNYHHYHHHVWCFSV